MSSALVDELLAVDPASLTFAELSDAVLDLDVEQSRVEAAQLRIIGEFTARQAYGADGAVSAPQWIRERCDVRAAEAASRVKFARLAREFPATGAAAVTLGTGKVRVLLGAVNRRTRDAYARDEQLLLGWAADMTVEDTVTLMRGWMVRVDEDGPQPHDPDRDEITLSPTLDGRWNLRGDLGPETGAALKTAIDQRSEQVYEANRNCPEGAVLSRAQRDGEALGLLIRDAMAETAAGQDSVPPAFTAIVDTDTIEGRTGRRCEIPGFGPIRGDTARRLLCECRLNRLITDAASGILDAGRTTYTVNRHQRRALVARDGGCGWPGCDMPHSWCDAHHIVFWGSMEGPTDIDKLLLLCRRHHRLVHEGHWQIERDDWGQVIVHRPDGTLLPPPIRSMDPMRAPPDQRAREPVGV